MEKLFIILGFAMFLGLFLLGASIIAFFIAVYPAVGWPALGVYILLWRVFFRANRIRPASFPNGTFVAGSGI
jgi:hypothetical protein